MASTTQAPRRERRLSTTDLALVAGFAALVVVCAILPALNVTGIVPITLQLFGVLLAGAVLGARRGLLAVLLYLALGAAGLPVFANGTSGLAVLAGPTTGYLLGFPLAAGLCGLLVQRLPTGAAARNPVLVAGCALAGVALLVHPLGIAGLVLRADLTWTEAVVADAPFWVVDALKAVAAAVVATAVHRAFPDLLPRRRGTR